MRKISEPDTIHPAGNLPDGILLLNTYQKRMFTRPLYEQVFADPTDFTDYYYEDKCKDNLIFVKVKDGAILSMVHLNPYTLSVNGQKIHTFYLVAIATHPDHRGLGYMSEVLNASFAYMKNRQVPFCYLLPVSESVASLYQTHGFQVIGSFAEEFLPYDQIKKQYDMYCIRDEAYERRLARETALAAAEENGNAGELTSYPYIMARILDENAFDAIWKNDGTVPQELPENDVRRLARLRRLRIYLREEV